MFWPAYGVFDCAATRVLNAVPNCSVKVNVLTDILVCVPHWLRLAVDTTAVVRPLCTKPTVGVGLASCIGNAPVVLILATTGAAPCGVLAGNAVASARILVIRRTRMPLDDWISITGTPWNVTELPLAIPWKTLYPAVGSVPCGGIVFVVTNTGAPPLLGITLETYSVQPVSGVGQSVWGAFGP